MSSLSYLELLKAKQAKLLKVNNLFKSGVGERSDFANKHLCGSDNVSFNHPKDSVMKLSFIRDVKLGSFNKRFIKLMDLCCDKYLLCSFPNCGNKKRFPSHKASEEVIHSGEKPFKCSDCKYAANRKYIKEHQLRKHFQNTGCKNVFVCDFDGCNFRTTLKWNAIKHHRRHLKIKSFKCQHPGCGRSFVSRSNLHNHDVSHGEKKRFRGIQNNCKFATKRPSTLRLHQATHSTISAFKCPHNNCSYAASKSPVFGLT